MLIITLSGFRTADNYNFKTIFVYNFTKYIKWPQEPGNIQIGILSEDPKVKGAFDLMAEKKSNDSKRFEIIKCAPASLPDGLEIIFIAKDQGGKLKDVVRKYQDKSTLIVTETEGAIENGSGINFIFKNEKLQFQLKEKRLEEAGLVVSKQLLSLAIVM